MTTQLRFYILVPPLTTLLLILLFPFSGFAAEGGGIVVCNPTLGADGAMNDPCTFEKLIEQAQKVINFLIFAIAAPLAAIMFAYAGFVYVTNGGNEGRIKEAHEIFWNVLIGFVVALSAWLVINFILVFFLGAGSPFNFLKAS